MTAIRREPLLADHLLATPRPSFLKDNFFDALKGKLREAKRFVLDEQAAIYVAQMIKDHPRIVADAQDFAIPPFETMWLEFPFKKYFQTLDGATAWDDARGDYRIGFLILGANAYVAGMSANGDAEFMPVVLKLNQPFTLDEELAFCETVRVSRLGLDAYFWGSSYNDLAEDKDKEGMRALRANHSVALIDAIPDKVNGWFAKPGTWGKLLETGNGDLRNIIAMLIFLNRTSNLQAVQDVGMSKQVMVNRRPACLLAHHVIRLTIDPAPRLAKLCAGEGVWRRLHDVRGHFCHNRTARENPHEHEWMEVNVNNHELFWVCACGGHRWWRREHHRGHADKGTVVAEYSVGRGRM